MKVFIDEYDNDYRAVTDTFEKEFETLEEAEQWCRDNKWSGYSYFIDRCRTKSANPGKIKERLTKAQMFDFILKNQVTLTPDSTNWTDQQGNSIKKKYTVSINDSGMLGYDLEDAIQYYHDNLLQYKWHLNRKELE